jgi:hypothetical protein
MTKTTRTRAPQGLSDAARSLINDFVEAAHALAGPKKNGRKNHAHPPVAFVWGHDSEPKEMQGMINMALMAGAAAVSLQFSKNPRLNSGPTRVVVVVTEATGQTMAYPCCQFWMAESDGTMLLVSPVMDPKYGHFAIVSGRLERRAGWPTADLELGIKRASWCLSEMVAAVRTAKGRCGTTMYELRFAV